MTEAIISFIGNHLLEAIKILSVLLVIFCALIVATVYLNWLYGPKDQESANEFESSHTPMSELADSFSADILIHPALKKQTELLRKMPGEQ